jgi:hypothetical protein
MGRHGETTLFRTDDIIFAAKARQCLNDLNIFFHANMIQTQTQIMWKLFPAVNQML